MLSVLPCQFDSLVHAPVRLAILSLLATQGPQDFSTIKQHLIVTDGALGMHLQKLVVAGYAKCQKAFFDGKPRSTYYLSQVGRDALQRYAALLDHLITKLKAPGILASPPRRVG